MIPIRDENPTRSIPWVTLALIAANIGVFIYEYTLGTQGLQAFWARWSIVPARLLADPFSPHQIATIFTSMFMHAGWIHLIGNMLYLWIFGNNIEDRLGAVRFIAFYLVSGVAAAAAQIVTAPASTVPMLGASGAVAGVLAAYLLLYPGASIVTIIPVFFFIEVARVPAYLVIGFWFVLQLGSGLASLGAAATTGGTAWFAHIGGFVAGLVLALPAWYASRRRSRSRRRA
ncbi:MAG: rhomboid family intramembrane serine protease [Coriobacteriia bacterium]|nr:rhomboid family intramembrane serine protease [Coriobacteriia bacterium]MBN2839544.1 rhomboid family intramembrane serine protease [Coriobacteriia bacterium]